MIEITKLMLYIKQTNYELYGKMITLEHIKGYPHKWLCPFQPDEGERNPL